MIDAVPPLVVGERFACPSRHAGRLIEVVIGRRDVIAGHPVVSVSIFLAGASPVPEVAHAPFDEATLRKSCPTRIAAGAAPAPEFEAGYRSWLDAKGGWFTLGVDEAVDAMASMVGASQGPAT